MKRNVDPEEFLKKFTLRSVPPALGEKIYRVPDKRKAPRTLWTPLQRKAVAAFLIFGCLAVLLDLGLTRLQEDRLAGLLNLPAGSIRENGSRAELLAEVWSGGADSAWIEVRLKLEKKLSGEENRQGLLLFLKEEFDGS